MILGVIADDFTGATDVASMLVRVGLRTVIFFSSGPMIGTMRCGYLRVERATGKIRGAPFTA